VLDEISNKIRIAKRALKRLGYVVADVSEREFFDYMTSEIFSDDTTTLRDVLGNEFLMIHEFVEISKLKKMGARINKRVIVDSSKIMIYAAHFTAMETELNYALFKGDTFWAKFRLNQHKTSVLEDDPNLPEEMRHRAEEMLKKFRKLIETYSNAPLEK
jgi:hypothetical protein